MDWKFPVAAFGSLLLVSAAGCGDDSDGLGAFGGMTKTTKSQFAAVDSQGRQVSQVVSHDETVVVDGRTYTRFSSKPSVDAPGETFSVFMNWTRNQVEFVGGEVFWTNNGATPADVPFVSGVTDSPVVVNLNPPLGVDQTVNVKGTAFLGDPADPANGTVIDVTATYRAVEKDTTVQTSLGSFSGCTRFTGETDLYGTVVNAEAWYHPEFGMMKGHLDWPEPNGSTLDLTGILDFGDPAATTNTIRKMGILDDSSPAWKISTYEVNNDIDADRTKHAKMLLELRYVDDEYATRSELQPQVSIEFGTTFGYFGHVLLPSPVSFFHPEENGRGYTFWWAFVDQASNKWDPGSDTYRINVDQLSGNPGPIQVTGRIIYHRVEN